MAVSSQDAYNHIKNYIDSNGGKYSYWYAGIASDIEQRLFGDHNVSKQNDKWAHDLCTSDTEARNAEEALLKLGCKGDVGGGDSTTKYVYAYLILSHTRQ